MAYDFNELGVKASIDNKLIVEVTRRFRVVYDTVQNDPMQLLQLPECPKVYDQHPTDRYSVCTKVAPEQHESSFNIWTIEATYSRQTLDYESAKENPLDRRKVVKWDTVEYQRPLIYDVDGKIVCNSAGDPPVPAYQVEDNRVTVSMTYNAEYVPTWIMAYRNAINSAPFSVEGIPIDAKCAKIKKIAVDGWKNELGILYRPVTIAIELREQQGPMNTSTGLGGTIQQTSGAYIPGFTAAIQDAGYYGLTGGNHFKLLENGLEPAQPLLLNGNGIKLTTPISVGDEYYRPYDYCRALDFSVLGFPP